jgi:hypothetical protein
MVFLTADSTLQLKHFFEQINSACYVPYRLLFIVLFISLFSETLAEVLARFCGSQAIDKSKKSTDKRLVN